jgi:hypothetical protein
MGRPLSPGTSDAPRKVIGRRRWFAFDLPQAELIFEESVAGHRLGGVTCRLFGDGRREGADSTEEKGGFSGLA